MENRPLIYTIVVTYNGKKWLDRCLCSLLNSTVDQKIVVIDNASTDGTPYHIKSRYPQVDIIESSKNIGFGKANNIGLTTAIKGNADFAFLLNQDAWVEPATIELLVTASRKFNQYGILSPVHLNGLGSSLDLNFFNYLMNGVAKEMIEDDIFQRERTIYRTDYVNAAAWLITRNCLKTVGLFDPLFTHYGEDNDYVLRAIYHKLAIGVVSKSFICHDREYRENRSINNIVNSMYGNNLFLFKNINLSLLRCFILYLRRFTRSIVNGLITFNITRLLVDCYTFMRILLLIRRIYINREKSKNDSAFIKLVI